MARYALKYLAINGTRLHDVTSIDADDGDTPNLFPACNVVHPIFGAITQVRPAASFQTRHVKDLLGLLTGSNDAPLVVLNAGTGLTAIEAQAASGKPGDASGSSHNQRVWARGVVSLASLSWAGPGAELLASCVAQFFSADGDAVADATSKVAAPAAPTVKQALVLTSATWNSVSVPDITGLTVTFDPRLTPVFDQGKPFPINAYGGGINDPVAIGASFETADPDRGLALHRTVNVLVLSFKGLAHGGGYSTDTLTITIRGLARRVRRRSPQGAVVDSIEIIGLHDGTNVPATLVTG